MVSQWEVDEYIQQLECKMQPVAKVNPWLVFLIFLAGAVFYSWLGSLIDRAI